MEDGDSIHLLHRWHNGDRDALEGLIGRNLEWVEERVRHRLGRELRQKFDTHDMVQDAMVQVLELGPRFEVRSEKMFRALLVRIVENDIRDRVRWIHRERRDPGRERRMVSDSILKLDPPAESVTSPSQGAAREERRAWVQLALEFLEPEDREALRLRILESKSYREIAEVLEVSDDAARMRTNRALGRLAKRFEQLVDGSVARAIEGDV